MVGFKNYLAEMIITRRFVACKNISLGQRSRSQPALKICALQMHSITSSCMVGFKNYLEEMVITTRRCAACKNYVTRSKVKVTAGTLSLCIPESCQIQNFIPKIGGIWKLFGTNDY